MSSLLLLKLLLVPVLIAGITLAGRRWGPAVAGWLSAFPVVSAPVLFFVALERGPGFAAQSATATLSAVLAILVFGIAYCRLAARGRGWPGCLLGSLLAYFAAVGGLDLWAPSLALTALALPLALVLAPGLYPEPPALAGPVRSTHGELLLRMLAGALLVTAVTGFAARLGPRLTGLFAMFPVMATVLAVFSQRQAGAGFAVRLLRGMVYGYWAFAAFCLSLALALPRLPMAPAFTLALTVAVTVQVLARRVALRALTPHSARVP